MSVSMSASERGLIARKATGSFKMLATVSGANGTEPIKRVGLSRITSRTSIFQQSPTCGRRPTGATSLHHLLTPTKLSSQRQAQTDIEVTFGASETMRNIVSRLFSPAVRFDVTLVGVSMVCAHKGHTQDSKYSPRARALRSASADLCLPFLDGLPPNGLTNLPRQFARLGNRRKQARVLIGSRGQMAHQFFSRGLHHRIGHPSRFRRHDPQRHSREDVRVIGLIDDDLFSIPSDTGGKGLPAPMIARPAVQRRRSSGAASLREVGFDSVKIIGRPVPPLRPWRGSRPPRKPLPGRRLPPGPSAGR